MFQANELLQNTVKASLILSENELDMMEDMLRILKVFKDASVELEAENTPTIHLVIPAIRRMKLTVQPEPGDGKPILNIKAKILTELEQKFVPHERHKLGLFLHPKFRLLNKLSNEERAWVCIFTFKKNLLTM